jgi:hypothetical protein
MSASFAEDLPDVLREIRTRPLFVLRATVQPIFVVGATPGAFRRIGNVTGGSFAGERLSGEVLNGNDWQAARADDSLKLDVRLLLRTDDGALVTMAYQGLRAGDPSVLARIDGGEQVDPADYYFRFAAFFETAEPSYDWLNQIVAIGVGDRRPDGPLYSVFEVL